MTARLKEKSKDCKFFHCRNEKTRLKIQPMLKKKNLQDSFLFFSSRQKKTNSRKIIVLLKEKRL